MATRKQIAANRRNARKATGPRTPEGKAICRLNGLRTGLHSRGEYLPAESWQKLIEIRDRFMQTCQPQTPEQHRLVAKVACAEWKLFHWKQIHEDLLRKAEASAGPRRQDRLRADFARRQARLENGIREAYIALEKAINPELQAPAPEECLPAA